MIGARIDSVATYARSQPDAPPSEDGVATGPMGGFDEGRIQRTFGLPDEWAVAAVCALGFPDEEFDRTLRKPLGDIVHWDTHGGPRVSTN